MSLFQAEFGSQCSLSHLRQQQQLPKQRTLTNTHAGGVSGGGCGDGGGTLPCRLSRSSSNSNRGSRCKGGARSGGGEGGDQREQQQKHIFPEAEESQHSPGPDTHPTHVHTIQTGTYSQSTMSTRIITESDCFTELSEPILHTFQY